MEIFQTIILSIIEGVTEFLPISSTGHMILAARIIGVLQTDFVKSFEIIIQLGAILAIVFLYRHKLLRSFDLWKKIIVAFIPTAILGLILYKFVKHFLLGNEWVTVLALAIGGLLMIVVERYFKTKTKIANDKKLSYKGAIAIGVGQSLAMIPGVSRSAASIITGMFVGLTREEAAEFSFILAIPTMVAATSLDLIKSGWSFNFSEWSMLALGFVISFLSAVLAVKYFVQYLQKHDLVPFAVYRIILAAAYAAIFLR